MTPDLDTTTKQALDELRTAHPQWGWHMLHITIHGAQQGQCALVRCRYGAWEGIVYPAGTRATDAPSHIAATPLEAFLGARQRAAERTEAGDPSLPATPTNAAQVGSVKMVIDVSASHDVTAQLASDMARITGQAIDRASHEQ